MGDIDMIMKLYQGIVKNSENTYNELKKIQDTNTQQKVTKLLKQLSYVLLNYSLRLIAQISDAIKGDSNKQQLKDSLMRHSVMIVYKLNAFIRNEIDDKVKIYKSLQDDLVRMGKIKLEMYKKIEHLDKQIKNQNEYVSKLSLKFDMLNHTEKLVSVSSNLLSSSSARNDSASYMFNDSDCYFTESGDDKNVDYLSSDK